MSWRFGRTGNAFFMPGEARFTQRREAHKELFTSVFASGTVCYGTKRRIVIAARRGRNKSPGNPIKSPRPVLPFHGKSRPSPVWIEVLSFILFMLGSFSLRTIADCPRSEVGRSFASFAPLRENEKGQTLKSPPSSYRSEVSKRYSVSRVRFFRLRLRARASLVRCFSPGFK